jgi:hypothetical protein
MFYYKEMFHFENPYIQSLFFFLVLCVVGFFLSWLTLYSNCPQSNSSYVTFLYEGIIWSLPISILYTLFTLPYTNVYLLPIFSDPFSSLTQNPNLVGFIYALLLMTSIMTARMFFVIPETLCVQTKQQLKEFEEKLAKSLKQKEANK